MEPFTIELVSHAFSQLFPDKTLNSFTKFLPEQLNLEGEWEVAFSGKTNPSVYQSVTEGNFMFFNKIASKLSEIYHLEPGVYPSITDIV